jgi:hypothetical protein
LILGCDSGQGSQSTGGDGGGEIRNCLSGVGGCNKPSSLTFLQTYSLKKELMESST